MRWKGHVAAFLVIVAVVVGIAAQELPAVSVGVVPVVVELDGQTVVEAWRQGFVEGKGVMGTRVMAAFRLATIERAQRELVRRVEAAGIETHELFRTQRVLNGIGMRVAVNDLAALRQLPGVRRVRPLTAVTPSTATSVPFIGAPEVWQDVPGLTGEGVSVGIVDTGVDYLHRHLGGSGDPAERAENDPTVLGDVGFPNDVVVGGWDFVGDDYNGDNEPVPDPDPMDCMGHGTQVAGIAGGVGVTLAGEAFPGPWDQSVSFDNLRIGPGVAPEADLYALRIFGCGGSSFMTVPAIDWAVDPNGDGDLSDHLDVLNLSLGSRYGGPDEAIVLAAQAATEAGVVVVCSAGNSEDAFFNTSAPGAAAGAISVASTVDDGLVFDELQVEGGGETVPDQLLASLADFAPDPGDPGVTASLVLASPIHGCTELANADAADGAVVLVEQWGCSSQFKASMAQAAGAVGMIVRRSGRGLPYTLFGSTDEVIIPVAMVTSDAGAMLRDAEGAVVTLSSSRRGPRPELADSLEALSSRGPRRTDGLLKPDLAAPGHEITSALVGTAAETNVMGGTSMAAPHVAGAAALLRQLHPSRSVIEVKAALMGTATHDVVSESGGNSVRIGHGRAGAGRVDLPAAAAVEVLASTTGTDGAVSVTFGTVDVASIGEWYRSVVVTNHSSSDIDLQIRYETLVDAPGVGVGAPTSVAVPAGGTSTFDVMLTANASLMPTGVTDPSAHADPTGNGLARHGVAEESGDLWLEGENVQLRLPVHAVVRPVASMRAVTQELVIAPNGGVRQVQLGGNGLDGSSVPGVRSLLSAFELVETSADEPDDGSAYDAGDLRFLGIASDAPGRPSLELATISFSVVTHTPWTSPNQVSAIIWIDGNEDGSDDAAVFTSIQFTANSSRSDTVGVFLYDVASNRSSWQGYWNGPSPAEIDTVPFMTSAMVLPVRLADLVAVIGDTEFSYRLELYATEASTSELVDSSAVHWFDAGRPSLTLVNPMLPAPYWSARPGEVVSVLPDHERLETTEVPALLLIHHHNAEAERAELIPISVAEPTRRSPRGSAGRP